jgi:hypothetical protein
MKRFSRREQVLIGACVLVALIVGLPALWEAVANRGPSPSASAARLRSARQERQAHATALTRLEQEFERVADRRPASQLPAAVMTALDRRARADGIQLREVRPLSPRPLDKVISVPVQLSFTAPFPQAARFLARLRTAPDRIAVDRVVIAATATNDDRVTVQALVSVFTLAPAASEERNDRPGRTANGA